MRSVFPQENSRKQDAVEVKMKDLKAIFFVKDFAGNREYQDDVLPELLKRGRKIEAAFSDGETLIGATEAYHPQKSGFFMFLADPKSNNTRVFVVNKNLPPHQVPLAPLLMRLGRWPALTGRQ